MPTTTDIGIFCIGHTKVDREEVQRWLDYMGVQSFELPEDGAVTNPALLIALACKRCFDDQTEILTDHGWKRFEDLDRTERVMTYNEVTGEAEWQSPHGYFVDEHDGPMISVEGRDLSMLVTPDHRVYGWPMRRLDTSPRFILGQSLLSSPAFCVPLSLGQWVGQTPEEIGLPDYTYQMTISNQTGELFGTTTRTFHRCFTGRQVVAFAKLLAYYSTEGTADCVGDDIRYIAIYGDHFEEVTRIANDLGLPCSMTTDKRNGCPKIRVGGGRQLARYVVQLCGKETEEKHLPRWVLDLPVAALRQVWDILVATDGNVSETGQETFQSTSRLFVDQAQEILVKLGMAAGLSTTVPKKRRKAKIRQKRTSYFARKKLRRFAVVNNSNTAAKAKQVPYRGRVYCVSTRNGIVCVRRKGKVYWSGNCYKSFDTSLNPNLARVRSDYAEYLDNVLKSGHGSALEHSVYNFAFEGVSRVMTAEMNRHRAGWAISEGSLRFIRFGENVPYWEPDSIKGPDVLTAEDVGAVDYLTRQPAPVKAPIEFDGHYDDALAAKKHATRIAFRNAFSHQQGVYRVLEAVWKDELAPDSKFKAKKEITSMMRRIIGLGVSTGGVWSGNIRALRHVLTMRCEPAAEEEILHVFTRVAKMIKDREPMLFGDFHLTPEGYWVPKYRKV